MCSPGRSWSHATEFCACVCGQAWTCVLFVLRAHTCVPQRPHYRRSFPMAKGQRCHFRTGIISGAVNILTLIQRHFKTVEAAVGALTDSLFTFPHSLRGPKENLGYIIVLGVRYVRQDKVKTCCGFDAEL